MHDKQTLRGGYFWEQKVKVPPHVCGFTGGGSIYVATELITTLRFVVVFFFFPLRLKNVWLPRLEVEKQKHRSCCQRGNKLLRLSAGKMKNKPLV